MSIWPGLFTFLVSATLSLHLPKCNLLCKIYVLRDFAYSLSMSVMKPFPDLANNPKRVRHFNYILSATRVVVENANARLKNKFQLLKYINNWSIHRARLITRCCLILHNFVIEHDTVVDFAEAREQSTTATPMNHIIKREQISRGLYRQ